MAEFNRSKTTLLWIAGGTGAAVLGSAILFQCLRAQPGTAAEGANGRAAAAETSSGKAKVSPSGNSQPQSQAATQGTQAARVSSNGKQLTISMDEVAQECMLRVGKDVLDSMINRTIIQLACQEQGIEVTRAEVDREIVRIAGEFKIPVEQYLQMLQAERSISPVQYRRDVIWPMLALKKLAGENVAVSAKEIQTAFEREYGPRVKARMILCENLRQAQAAWKKAKEKPDDFEKVVQEFSIDPASKSLDGSIPPIPRHSGSPNLEGAAFKLKTGEISAVVQLDDAMQRYVILKCKGRTEPVVERLDEQVQAELEEQLKKQKVQEMVGKVFESIKKDTRIDNYFANTVTGAVKPTNTASLKDGAKSAGSSVGEVQQAGASGATTGRVKQAAAESTNDDDVPAATTRPAVRRPATGSNK